MKALPPKRELFLQEYVKDFNGTRAYKTVYHSKSDNSAAVEARKLLRNPQLKERLTEIMNATAERNSLTEDMIIDELKCIAFSKGSDYTKSVKRTADNQEYEIDVAENVPTDELTETQKKAISCIENTKYGVKVSTYDKVKALELLGKHIGMFRDKVDISAEDGGINILVKYE